MAGSVGVDAGSSSRVDDFVGVDRAERRAAVLEDDLQLVLGELRAALLAAVTRRLQRVFFEAGHMPRLYPSPVGRNRARTRSTFGSRKPAPRNPSSGSALFA